MAARRWGQAVAWTVIVGTVAGALVGANQPRRPQPTSAKRPGG